jgi:hypothetical protein
MSNGHKIYQMAITCTKWPQNKTTSSIIRPTRIYPNHDFWFENIPTGNHDEGANITPPPGESLTIRGELNP